MDKHKLKQAFQAIERQHGPGTVFRLGSTRRLHVETLTTGVFPIDLASGVGGFPRGRIIELYGPPSGGKTTLALHAIAEAQKQGGAAAFIDAEHALDPVYAKAIGVDVDNLIVSQPMYGEQALEVAEQLIKSEQFDIVVVDSVAALVPKKELEGEMGDAQMGSQARMMSQGLRKLNGTVSTTRTCLVFINQTRNKLGVMYGNPETTPGGDALKFWSSMRITVRPGEQIKIGSKVIGGQSKIKFVKNKVAAPFREAIVENLFGFGFEPMANLLDAAVEIGVLKKNGSRYVVGEQEIANGRENAIEMLRLNHELGSAIMAAAREKAFGEAPPAEPEETEANEEENTEDAAE